MVSSTSRKGKVKPTVNKKGSLCFHFKLTLLPGRDDDLIAELLGTPFGHVSAKVREMMRGGISSGRFLAEEDGGERVSVDMNSVGVDL